MDDMLYLTLLYDDEANLTIPGTPEFDAEMAAYDAFGAAAGEAIMGGEALEPSATARTVRGDGDEVRISAGPFAEATEVLGGLYVLEADTLDDVIELARLIPAAALGAIELRPMVQWSDRSSEVGPSDEPRWLCTIHGPETAADDPDGASWGAGAAEHGRFAELAGDALVAAAAVHPTSSATTIRVRDGELLVSDGPFAEASEVVGGCYVLRGDADAVAQLAARIPVNPGGAVEVRPVMELDG
jgi:hypothetical protein